MTIWIFFATLLFPIPNSFPSSPGVHLYSYDGQSHRSEKHYQRIVDIVFQELSVKPDSIPIYVIFVDEGLKIRLAQNNPEEFQGVSWQGYAKGISMIYVYGESDATVMHEVQHLLVARRKLYQDVPENALHYIIRQNELLLLGSRPYLEYLREDE